MRLQCNNFPDKTRKKVWIQRCILLWKNTNTFSSKLYSLFTVCVDWLHDIGRMLQVVHKQKLTLNSIAEKYKLIKEVNIGNSCASVAKTHNIPKQTLSNWLKKKKQVYESIDSKSSTMKRQRFRGLPYENLDKTCYKWLVNTRGQNIPISATMLKTKALFFARELGCNDLRVFDCWLDQWKKRKNVSFKTISGVFTYFFLSSWLKMSANSLKRVKLNMTQKCVYIQIFDLLEHLSLTLFEFQFEFNWSLPRSKGNFLNNVEKSILN